MVAIRNVPMAVQRPGGLSWITVRRRMAALGLLRSPAAEAAGDADLVRDFLRDETVHQKSLFVAAHLEHGHECSSDRLSADAAILPERRLRSLALSRYGY